MSPHVTFVLGGGGGPGLAFHCGALAALADVTGIGPGTADLVIGTSAGSVVGARVAGGTPVSALYDEARADRAGDDAHATLLVRSWHSRLGLARAALGAGLAVTRTVARVPASRHLIGAVERVFPPGLFAIADWEVAGLPAEWPDPESGPAFWAVAIDTSTNRRVVLRRPAPGHRGATLTQAVAASCAVPGVFAPVRVGGRALVDGGCHSPTNIDLAARVRSRVVIALAPLAHDPSFPIGRGRAAARSALNAQTRREMRAVTRAGGRTLLLRPSGEDLAVRRGGHLLSQDRSALIAERAYDTTCEVLRRPYAQRIAEAVHELRSVS